MAGPSELPGRVHGGITERDAARAGVDADDVIDFSASINPYGPSPAMREAIDAVRVDRYPDPDSWEVRTEIAPRLGTTPAEVALGNGASELLWTLARVLLGARSRALIVEPTFGEFRAAATAMGAAVREWRAREPDFALDLEAVGAHASDADVVYLCVPNSPTGTGIPADAVARLAACNPAVQVVLDQSFLSLSTRWADASVAMPANVVRVRSLTKDHAIPGVRAGYALAAAGLVRRIAAARPPWMVSAHAEAATRSAFRDDEFVARCRAQLADDRENLRSRLASLGLQVVPSMAPFLMVRTGHAAEVGDRLLRRHRILVRDCTSFGLPDFIRVAARPRADGERLVAALSDQPA